MYGDQCISLDARSRSMDRDVRFLEMALPGLCITCAKAYTNRWSDPSIVDSSCEYCAHDPPVAKPMLSAPFQKVPYWWKNTETSQGSQFQYQKDPLFANNLLQQQQQQQQRYPFQPLPRPTPRMSWDSAFSSDTGSTKSSEDSVTTLSSSSLGHRRPSKPLLFSRQSTQLEWPDWTKWLTKDDSMESYSSDEDSSLKSPRGSFDSTSSGSTLFDNVCNIDEPPLLSRSPSPVPESFANEDEEVFEHKSEADNSTQKLSMVEMQQALMHPAKTGFALWVGNLSSKTTLSDLRMLFGTENLQSIYLIQRTGCAFVNYTTMEALETATKLFESRGASLHDNTLVIKPQVSYTNDANKDNETCANEEQLNTQSAASNSPDRYFICKSLTVEDLELAKKTGKWSTQMRNMDKFNDAFHQSNNVYLVFSANRTSAFYGIARLDEPFTEPRGDNDNNRGAQTVLNTFEEWRQPEVSYTDECYHPMDNTYIPPGETVFDPLRGSQFWKVKGCPCVEPEVEKWTSPARISWISSSSSVIPFSRTRQLKNSFNMNKPIKVARDGTEIDPEVGTKLFNMFSTV